MCFFSDCFLSFFFFFQKKYSTDNFLLLLWQYVTRKAVSLHHLSASLHQPSHHSVRPQLLPDLHPKFVGQQWSLPVPHLQQRVQQPAWIKHQHSLQRARRHVQEDNSVLGAAAAVCRKRWRRAVRCVRCNVHAGEGPQVLSGLPDLVLWNTPGASPQSCHLDAPQVDGAGEEPAGADVQEAREAARDVLQGWPEMCLPVLYRDGTQRTSSCYCRRWEWTQKSNKMQQNNNK